MSVNFQYKPRLPQGDAFQQNSGIINSIGVKWTSLYYARKLQTDFPFPEIDNIKKDLGNTLMLSCSNREGSLWSMGGLRDLTYDSFGWTNPLIEHVDYEEAGLTEDDIMEQEDCASVFDLGNMSSYAFLALSCKEEDFTLPYDDSQDSDDVTEDISRILYDRFCREERLPYPKNNAGRLARCAMRSIAKMIYRYSYFYEETDDFLTFQEDIAFSWLCRLNEMYMADFEEDEIPAAVVQVSHPYGELVHRFCMGHSDESFFQTALDIIDSCLKQLSSSVCETGEDPDWYECGIVKGNDALGITLVYPQDSDYELTVIHTAVYLLMQTITAVYDRVGLDVLKSNINCERKVG